MKRVIGIDFFSGCGGTSLGLSQAGVHVLRGIDFDKSCKDVYESNVKGADFLEADISKLKPETVFNNLKISKSDYILFSACAPCQPFSKKKNSNLSNKPDKRVSLLLEFLKFVKFHSPHFLFIENVPGIQNIDRSDVFSKFLKAIEKLGYKFVYDVVDAKSYGVPQSRKRLILIATRIKNINLSLPKPSHGPNLKPFVTVRDTIQKLPAVEAGKATNINGHQARKLSPQNIIRIKNTPKDGGDRRSWSKKLRLPCHSEIKSHTDVYGRMFWDKPAPTLTCKCTSISNGRYGHPVQNRGLTPREAALLQTFPLNFKLTGGVNQMTRHVGNAVPPLLAKKIGQSILDSL